MDLLRNQASPAQCLDGLTEPVDLQAGEGIGRVVRNGEVREGAGDPDRRGPGHHFSERRHVTGRNAQPAHPGVHLEVHRRMNAPPGGGAGQRLDLVGTVNRRHEVVLQKQVRLPRREPAEHQDRGGHARLPQLDPLLGDRHTQALDPFLHQGTGDAGGTVAVSIGLDDRQDGTLPDAVPHRLEIGGQGQKVDLGPGGPAGFEEAHHPPCCSSSSKRVYWRRKAMLNSPVGPLRCLAMMTVATPRFSSVGLYISSR